MDYSSFEDQQFLKEQIIEIKRYCSMHENEDNENNLVCRWIELYALKYRIAWYKNHNSF